MSKGSPSRWLRWLTLFCIAWFLIVLIAYIFIEDVRNGAHDVVLMLFDAP